MSKTPLIHFQNALFTNIVFQETHSEQFKNSKGFMFIEFVGLSMYPGFSDAMTFKTFIAAMNWA